MTAMTQTSVNIQEQPNTATEKMMTVTEARMNLHQWMPKPGTLTVTEMDTETALKASCSQPSGYVSDSTDCNDSNSQANPGGTEVCNSIDDNCDGSVDEDTAADVLLWYQDSDGDGYGNAFSTTVAPDISQTVQTVMMGTAVNIQEQPNTATGKMMTVTEALMSLQL